jgi:hypothetical protein
VANYPGPWSQLLENGGYPPEEARQAALTVLPDILRYDRTKPATSPRASPDAVGAFQALLRNFAGWSEPAPVGFQNRA